MGQSLQRSVLDDVDLQEAEMMRRMRLSLTLVTIFLVSLTLSETQNSQDEAQVQGQDDVLEEVLKTRVMREAGAEKKKNRKKALKKKKQKKKALGKRKKGKNNASNKKKGKKNALKKKKVKNNKKVKNSKKNKKKINNKKKKKKNIKKKKALKEKKKKKAKAKEKRKNKKKAKKRNRKNKKSKKSKKKLDKKEKKKARKKRKRKEKKLRKLRKQRNRQGDATAQCKQSDEVSTNCLQNAADAMTFLEKQATNFLNQWRRIQSFNKTINGKLSKNGAFANVTGYLLTALGGDSSNVSCGETGARDAASSAKALQTYNTLKNCSKSITAACTMPASTVPADVISKFTGFCMTKFNEAKTASDDCRTNKQYTSNGTAAWECWSKVGAVIAAIKSSSDCSASTYSKAVKQFKNACVQTFVTLGRRRMPVCSLSTPAAPEKFCPQLHHHHQGD